MVDDKLYRSVQWDVQVKPYPDVGPNANDSHPEWEGHTMDQHPEWARVDAPITHAECR